MNGSHVELLSSDGGRFKAYVSVPQAKSAPGLLLLQYICGVNKVMRDLADGFAREGYLVAVPDLFWRQQPGIEIINDPSRPSKEEMGRALALNEAFQDAPAVEDMLATLSFLRGHAAGNGRAGTLGYCLGGRLAYLMAARSDTDCSVSYYGVNLEKYLDEAGAIRRPLLMHMAEQDALVPPAAREKVVAALAGNPQVAITVHPGVNHAFALVGGPNYVAATADKANAASLRFLRQHLLEK